MYVERQRILALPDITPVLQRRAFGCYIQSCIRFCLFPQATAAITPAEGTSLRTGFQVQAATTSGPPAPNTGPKSTDDQSLSFYVYVAPIQ